MPKLIENHLLGTINSARGALLESMIIFTAIELCGSFLTGNTGRPKDGRPNFRTFWDAYMSKQYRGKADLLYDIVRHGVAHSFVAKGGVIPSGRKDGLRHLRCYSKGIFIYMPQLKKDVMVAISKFLLDLHKKSNKKLRRNYCFVLSSIKIGGDKKYKNFIEKNKIKVAKGNFGKGDIEKDIKC